MTTTDEREPWEGWCLLELMGHRKLAGLVTRAEVCGEAMMRVDVPGPDGTVLTQFYSPKSLYAFTPVSEEIARGYAARNTPAPVHRYELPALEAKPAREPARADSRTGFEPKIGFEPDDEGNTPYGDADDFDHDPDEDDEDDDD